jgi:hypothetical protein
VKLLSSERLQLVGNDRSTAAETISCNRSGMLAPQIVAKEAVVARVHAPATMLSCYDSNAASSSAGILYVCCSSGNAPSRTSSAKRANASTITSPRSA